MQAMPRIGLVAVAGMLSGAALAAGYHLTGSVSIFESSSRQYMQATMNVCYNTTIAGSPYVLVNGYANSSITIAGRDSENEYFSCYVLPTSPLYATAVAMQTGASDGSRLYVYKQTSSGECENFSLGQYSYFQS